MNKEVEFPVKNNSPTVVIPPFSVVRAVGFDDDTGAIKVDAPSIDSQEGLIVTGEGTILGDGFGKGSYANKCIVGYDTAGTPAFGDSFGSVSGSFRLKKGNHGFRYVGGEFLGIMNAVRSGLSLADIEGMIPPIVVSTGCGWLAEAGDVLLARVIANSGRCDCINSEQLMALILTGGEWIASPDFESCLDADMTLTFANAPPLLPSLTLTSSGSSPVVRQLQFDYCTTDKIAFTGAGTVYCDGEFDPCGENLFRIEIELLRCCNEGLKVLLWDANCSTAISGLTSALAVYTAMGIDADNSATWSSNLNDYFLVIWMMAESSPPWWATATGGVWSGRIHISAEYWNEAGDWDTTIDFVNSLSATTGMMVGEDESGAAPCDDMQAASPTVGELLAAGVVELRHADTNSVSGGSTIFTSTELGEPMIQAKRMGTVEWVISGDCNHITDNCPAAAVANWKFLCNLLRMPLRDA